MVGSQFVQQQIAVARDRGQQVVEVVGDSAGKTTDGLHLLGLAQSLLALTQRFFSLLLLGDVDHQAAELHVLSRLVDQADRVADPDNAAVGCDHAVLDLVAAHLGDGLGRGLDHALQIVRVDVVSPEACLGQPPLDRETKNSLGLFADE